MWFVRMIFWLQAFIVPVIVLGVISFFVSPGLRIFLLIAAVILGILVAEYIRRRFGLESFFGRIYGPNDMDEKLKKK
jgi:hypothetical protein